MSTAPTEYLLQQFNTIQAMYNGSIIIDNIKPNKNKNIFTYRNQVKKSELRSPISAKYFNCSTQYLAMFKSRSYHFLFNDYSIGRFHYEFDKNQKLVSYNLQWFPCPFSKGFMDEIEGSGIHTFEFLDTLSEADSFKYVDFTLRTPIRVDYDAEYDGNKASFHPTSHIHFQHTETRAKNNEIFCLYKFLNFIVENCYPELNYIFHESEINITKDMMSQSKHWLRTRQALNDDYGHKIYTNYTF